MVVIQTSKYLIYHLENDVLIIMENAAGDCIYIYSTWYIILVIKHAIYFCVHGKYAILLVFQHIKKPRSLVFVLCTYMLRIRFVLFLFLKK